MTRACASSRGSKRVTLLLTLILATGCATVAKSAPAPDALSDTIPVSVSSIPSVYGVQLRTEGRAVLRDGWLYVELRSGSVRTFQGTTDAWDLAIRAGLATCDGKGGWKLVSESRAARIAPLIGLSRDSATIDTTLRAFGDTLRLDLGVPHGVQMDRTWLTVEVAWPIQSVIADYTLPASGPLAGSRELGSGTARNTPPRTERICRRG
jgi:hypothetical protein